MAGTQDIINETQENAMAGVDASIPPGAGINSPEERDAIRRAISAKGAWSGMDVARSAFMGAGLGAQTQATNPMTAFLQGVSAGLGAPAEVFKAKQDQIKSAVGASPFGAIVEEANNPDNPLYAFRGLPYELVSKAVSGIALESVKIAKQGEEERKTQQEKANLDIIASEIERAMKGKSPMDIKDQLSIAKSFEDLTPIREFQTAAPAFDIIMTAEGAAGDKAILVNYARMLNPTIRVSESTMDAVDVSSILDKYTLGLWKKAVAGESMTDGERKQIRREAAKIYSMRRKNFQQIADIWTEKLIEQGVDPRVIVSERPKEVKIKTLKDGSQIRVYEVTPGNFVEAQ